MYFVLVDGKRGEWLLKYSCKVGSWNEYTTEIHFHRTDSVSLSINMIPILPCFSPKASAHLLGSPKKTSFRTTWHKCAPSHSYTVRIPCLLRATSEWEIMRACGIKREKVFLNVYLISRGPLWSSQLCREKSPQHASSTLSADTNEPDQLILNYRAPRVVKVRHSISTSSWGVLSAVNTAEIWRLHLSLY